ncbi:MAG: ABC transporter ATP-binding protein [Bacteroidales bacterium]
MDRSIVIEQITKTYGKVRALNDISLSIGSGELFGLIGADGAGKSSLFEILATLNQPDSGTAKIGDLEVPGDKEIIRSTIGYMPGRFSLYQDLSVSENLHFFATIFGTTIEQGYDLIAPIWSQLLPFGSRPAGKLSGGMKQKLALCCALVHEPAVLLLDEPTTGVDPVARKEFWDILETIRAKGITILVSTPYMDEALRCDRIAFIHEGRILIVDTPDNLIKGYSGHLFEIRSDKIYSIIDQIRLLKQTKSCFAFGQSLHWSTDLSVDEAKLLLTQSNIVTDEMKQISPTIEDCFMQLMK